MGPALLFCPADRPERYAKAAERADAVILDLEDAVNPESKAAAREALIAQPLDPARSIVRLNAAGTADHELDLAALAQTEYRTVMLAKAESREDLAGLGGIRVIVLCESARGILAAAELAAADAVVGLMWGAEDLLVSLGGSSSRHDDGRYRDVALHSRSTVLLAAASHGKAAIDAVYVNIPDAEGLAAEARDAVASGFAATACIHPSQVDTIRAAYAPDPAELEWAHAVLAAAEGQRGAFRFEGKMIDGPVLRHAERLIARAS